MASEENGFKNITYAQLRTFLREEKARVKHDKVATTRLVIKGGPEADQKANLIRHILSYFGSEAPQHNNKETKAAEGAPRREKEGIEGAS